MMDFSFPFETSIESISLGAESFEIERLKSLDETIDAFFAEYERTNRAELFEGLCPYFGVPWQAGISLARKLAIDAKKWRGREVLELGCGLALPSMVLARDGAIVTATDLHPDVPVFLERNKSRNHLLGPDFLFLDWRLNRSLPPAELVFGSDIVYDRQQPEQLVEFLRNFPSWREAVFTDPGRPHWDHFVDLMKRESVWTSFETLEQGVFLLEVRR
jgi:predicted nicotinamide N-methyase